MSSVLVIAAHPDDEVLGVGGTIKRFANEGHEISVMVMDSGRHKGENGYDLVSKAMEGITKNIYINNLPDNMFDTVPLIEIVEYIENHLKDINPEIIFTHYRNDLNIDHRIVYQAVITATRPMADQTVKEIYLFEVPSSTEWNFPTGFSPNVFVNISVKDKLAMLANAYSSELRDYPHPRSLRAIRNLAAMRGSQVGLRYAEAFETVRIIK